VRGFDYTCRSLGVKLLHQGVGDLRGEPLLDLQALGITLHESGQFAQAHDLAVGQVGHVRPAGEGHQVMLADGVKLNVAQQNDFVVPLVEDRFQVAAGILGHSAKEFGVSAGHAGRGFQETFAAGVFTDGGENLAHGPLDARQIDGRVVFGWFGAVGHELDYSDLMPPRASAIIRRLDRIGKYMTSQEIRAQFIDFFVKRHGHTFVPSSPVVPLDDPTLLFTNAGMNQFKPIFLGQEKRSYVRATNAQKCIRAGGKHNDLDDVGRSRRHHTFFEMLGNWSFGDYFKQGAIEMAWELLTKVWNLDPTRLHVSCYEGDEKHGIPRDEEAAGLWKKIAGLPDDHIHYFGKDNFWEMGETGPCGPCTEIFIDRTPNKSGGKDVNGENPAVMEIWNLVFIQYNRDAAGKLTTLPAQHVDTGMGLERICQVVQDKSDNYATDLWTPLFEKIAELSGKKYTGKFPRTNAADPVAEAADAQLRYDIAFRVVADHIRCLTFALTDGAVPSNEGRGYVLRRILRRAVRFGRQQLEFHEPFLHKLVPVIVETMSGAFPELEKNPRHVGGLIEDEEVSFGRTLDRGIMLFEEAVQSGKISGHAAFKLHDTYGFPIDLTRIMAEERGMEVDIAGYEKLMEEARELARAGGKEQDSSLADLSPDALSQLADANVEPTDDRAKFSRDPFQARVMAIWNGDDLGLSPASVFEDEELAILLDRTNFYAEMGGQVGDRGELRVSPSPGTPGKGGGEGRGTERRPHPSPPPEYREREEEGHAVFDVASTKIVGGYVLHIGRVRSGKIRVSDTVTAAVTGGRDRTEKNHTSTHVANWALREVLGEGVEQKGSLVDPDKLRFDFSHSKAMTDEELGRVESLVNQQIAAKLPVYWENAPQEKAIKINGLRAVFGEKYPPMVRVVSIGVPLADLLADPAKSDWRKYSIEFCGGTHLSNTGDAQAFCLTAEESVSKGIRRIVALTGEAARKSREQAEQIDSLIAKADQLPDEELAPSIAELQKILSAGNLPLLARRRSQLEINELQTRLRAWEKKQQAAAKSSIDPVAAAGELLAKATAFGPGKLIIGEIAGASDEQLRQAIDSLKKKAGSYGILLAASDGQKVSFVAAVSDDLIAKGLKAGDWVREAAKAAGGGGGGRPQMAQAGGKDPSKLPQALEAARSYAEKAHG
jgi:alanyl-tRNA synthetase